MSVLLIFDKYGIDDSPAIVAALDDLQALRGRIDRHLRNAEADGLRIRLKPEYRPRFADFIGLRGVECLDIEPRSAFARRFGFAAPGFATDAALAKLLLNPSPHPAVLADDDAAGAMLALLNPALSRPATWPAFCAALAEPLLADLAWLDIEPVRLRLAQSAALFLPAEAAAWWVGRLAAFATPTEALAHLGQQRLGEHLRGFIQRHGLQYALPGRAEAAPALAALPLWPVSADDLGEKWLDDWLGVLELAAQAATAGHLAPAELAGLAAVAAHWPRWLAALVGHLAEHRALATAELAEALDGVGGAAAALAAEIREQLAACGELPENADSETARGWLKEYLAYALRRFLAEQEPDEAVSMSFSGWVLRQQARIARSPMDWRYAARTIEEHLRAPDTRVIVCMVDALSALYNAEVLDIVHPLAGPDELAVEADFLIAPYPSLTEIGKNAVLTGKPAEQTIGPVENRLYQTFQTVLTAPDQICVLKSWEERSQPIPKQTRLLVYLENRIDERLHDCVNYKKFHDEVLAILKQLAKDVQRWLKQARQQGLEPMVLITADHGVSYIRKRDDNTRDLVGNYGERTISFAARPGPQQDFAVTEAGGKHYLLPLRRVRLQGDTPLSHGGLTPEELVIPCIILRRQPIHGPAKTPLQIRLHQHKAITVSDGWQLPLVLSSTCPAHHIKLEALPPFRGSFGPCGPLPSGEQITVPLLIYADCPQEGLTQVELTATFARPDIQATETLLVKLDVLFPPRLLEKSPEAANFENSF